MPVTRSPTAIILWRFWMNILLFSTLGQVQNQSYGVEINKGALAEKVLDDVVKKAFVMVDAEEQIVRRRLDQGVDKEVTKFSRLSPQILGASMYADDLASNTEDIAKPARIINWIHAISRSKKLDADLSVFLNSRLSQLENLYCPYKPSRDCSSVHRSIDGRCNNLNNPLWGAGLTPLLRLVPAQYEKGEVFDDVSRNDLPRSLGRNGQKLPSPRLISNVVHTSDQPEDTGTATDVNMAYTHFGQFLSHDITDTPKEKGANGVPLACCNDTISTRRCHAIRVPTGDFFELKGSGCLNFQRSTEVTDIDCKTGAREQLNMISAFLDGTPIYSSSNQHLRELRAEQGELRSSIPDHLPYMKHPNDLAFSLGVNLLQSGDERVSAQPGLVGMITIWLREHNRIARFLAKFNRFCEITDPASRSNKIFQEARKILIAQIQHVTYSEYLPLTVGDDVMSKLSLRPTSSGFFTGYDNKVNPALRNVISTAAMRFGHVMVRQEFSLPQKDFKPSKTHLRLKSTFFRSNFYMLFESGIQRGMLTDSSETCNPAMADDLRNHMFETTDGNGNDLASINIQRGRDHGLPGYNTYRTAVGLSSATEFSTLTQGFKDMSQERVSRLKRIYKHPDDVDVWSGGVSESHVKGGQVGPLFAELIGKQFERLRVGDRFWYENEDTGFTADQLKEIKKITFAKILCNNVDSAESVPRNAFKVTSADGINTPVRCDSLNGINLELWRNKVMP